MRAHTQTLRRSLVIGSFAALIGIAPALAAQIASFSGTTVGTYALSNIAGSGQNGTPCVGYGDQDPDHSFNLSEGTNATITVDSDGDTTLLVRNRSTGTVYCGQDISRGNLDDSITANLESGNYDVWVGSHSQGQRIGYGLSVSD
ncbi:MAG: hypothetical protein ACFB0C_09910 [Leptolyngbyaceae cyanobacterium]